MKITKRANMHLRIIPLLLIALFMWDSSITTVFAATLEDFKAVELGTEFYDPTAPCAPGGENTGSGGSGVVPIEGDHPQRAYSYFVSQGLTPAQSAGIVGNLMVESGDAMDPTISSPSGAYRGLAQWSATRYAGLEAWASQNGKDHAAFETQLQYIWKEATDRGDIEGLKLETTPEGASNFWVREFEGAVLPNGGGYQGQQDRIDKANQVFNAYKNTTATTPGTGKTTIALDPGHGGAVPEYTDPVTGLRDRETPNSPEREDVQEVANRVKGILEQAGYGVVLLKNSATQAINKRDRVNIATFSKATVAVSIHTDGSGGINQVWPQRVGKYRQNHSDSKRVTFENQQTATSSEQWATIMAEERSSAEGHEVTTDPNQTTQSGAFSQDREGLGSYGDISLVQLWSSDIPWLYNEIAQDSGTALSEARKQAYADGIANGIKRAVPVGAETTNEVCEDAIISGEGLAPTILSYAWPEYHSPPYPNKKPAYETAINQASGNGQYVGGGKYPGVDCGGFVTRLMIDSGFEPGYNFGGATQAGASNVAGGQIRWIQQNWDRVSNVDSTDDLQQGDVAINTGRSHTFMYAGTIPGFGDDVASASYSTSGQSWRAPMAGKENPLASNIEWYRKRSANNANQPTN